MVTWSKTLATTLRDTKSESDSDDQEEKFIAFIATVELPNEDEELMSEDEELTNAKFEKLDENDDIQIAYSKLIRILKSMKSFTGLWKSWVKWS